MGCAPSGSAKGVSHNVADEHHDLAQWLEDLVGSEDPHNLLTAYVEIEKNILNEEGRSPASALSVAVGRQQYLKDLIQFTSEKKDRSGGLLPKDNSFRELFDDLGLKNSAAAVEHEEFLANVNRRELNLCLLDVLGRRAAAVEDVIRTASLGIGKLQLLYEKQDMLLGRIYGNAYGSEREMMIEQEIDTMRNYRDAFSNGAFQWRQTAKDVKEAADLMTRGVAAWKNVHNQQNMDKKIEATSEARNAIQEAVFLVELSQELMSGVQFPYCTKRELTSVSQAIEYIFTDIFIDDRYRHALQVYVNFQERASALWQWITEVLNATLGKDLADIDRNILELSKSLRDERIAVICNKLGIENNYRTFHAAADKLRPAVLPDGGKSLPGGNDYRGKDNAVGMHAFRRMLENTDLHSEFEKNLVARRNAMWPSRRIDELRMASLDQYS